MLYFILCDYTTGERGASQADPHVLYFVKREDAAPARVRIRLVVIVIVTDER